MSITDCILIALFPDCSSFFRADLIMGLDKSIFYGCRNT